jgi:hypothetical protein
MLVCFLHHHLLLLLLHTGLTSRLLCKISQVKKWEVTHITAACGGCLVVTLKSVCNIVECKCSCAPISADSVSAVYRSLKKMENWRNKRFISFKTRAKLERAVTWWNPALQMHPLLDSSSLDPILMLPRRTWPYSASSVIAIHFSCHVISVFLFVTWMSHYMYRIWYYPQFHVTTVGLGTYYLWVQGHTCTKSVILQKIKG